MFGMIFDPLISKWMIQIFENAVSTNWTAVIHFFIYLAALYGFDLTIQVIRSITDGRRMQYFHRYKIYVLYKRIYENDISFFIDRPGGRILSDAQQVTSQLNTLTQQFYSQLCGNILGFLFILFTWFGVQYIPATQNLHIYG